MIDAHRADSLVFDRSELSLEELPPVPEWFQNQVNEAGGFFDDDPTKPNVRVVSGLDPNIMEFYGGGWHRKYVRREVETYQYFVAQDKLGNRKYLTPAEAKTYPKKLGIVLPMMEKKVTEHGVPRYFVELYKPPHAYGDPQSWEEARYLDADEPTNLEGKLLDMLGEFPEQGGYDTWFSIEEPVFDDNGKVIMTKFKPLDEDVLIFIKYMIEKARTDSMAKQHQDSHKKQAEDWKKMIDGIREDTKDIIKDRIDRIVGTPKIVVPDLKGVK